MTRKIVNSPSIKDENGHYIKADPSPTSPIDSPDPAADLSIDVLMQRGLGTIERVLQACALSAKTGSPSRESVMNLKDCMAMLENLKKREAEILDKMTPEELEKASK